MGLDSVEILMKVEETFGISIPDAEAAHIITLGDFYNVVWCRVAANEKDYCYSKLLFYKFRKYISKEFQISTKTITPDLPLKDIFPAQKRRSTYYAFGQSLQVKLPGLVLSNSGNILLINIGVLLVGGGFVVALYLVLIHGFSLWSFLLPVFGTVLTMLVSILLEPMRTCFKEQTVREFINRTVILNLSELISQKGISRKEMEVVINCIITDIVGIDTEDLTADKMIGADLGID